MAVTAIGLIRLPDFYARTHASSKTETLGIGLLLGGLALHEGVTLVSLKIVLGLLFISIANPVAVHVLARSALRVGIMPWMRRDSAREL